MKITINMPDEIFYMVCNYVFYTDTGWSVGVKNLEANDLHDGNEIIINPYKGGD
jgi:hypothetical protein